MALLRYITHPDVEIDPDLPVPTWGLSAEGRRRAAVMVTQTWARSLGSVVSSSETKALQTARLLADHLGIEVEVRPSTGEIDRSATGFVSEGRHEELADRFFSEPGSSAEGWETAHDAQNRIVEAVADLVTDSEHDVAVVGHGAVGTLLMCHLAGLVIERRHDQPGQGHFWTLDRATRRLLHGWRPIDL